MPSLGPLMWYAVLPLLLSVHEGRYDLFDTYAILLSGQYTLNRDPRDEAGAHSWNSGHLLRGKDTLSYKLFPQKPQEWVNEKERYRESHMVLVLETICSRSSLTSGNIHTFVKLEDT